MYTMAKSISIQRQFFAFIVLHCWNIYEHEVPSVVSNDQGQDFTAHELMINDEVQSTIQCTEPL